MNQAQTIRFNIAVPADLHRQFKAAAALRGDTLTDAVLRMMRDYIAETHADANQNEK